RCDAYNMGTSTKPEADMYRFSLSALSRAGSLIVATLIAVQGGLALAAAPHEREASVSRQDQVTVDGKTLGYTATAGKLLVFDADRNPAAEIFYIAYTLNDTDAGERPITFVWDGGPGGAAIAGNSLGLGPNRYFPPEPENAGPRIGHLPTLTPCWLTATWSFWTRWEPVIQEHWVIGRTETSGAWRPMPKPRTARSYVT